MSFAAAGLALRLQPIHVLRIASILQAFYVLMLLLAAFILGYGLAGALASASFVALLLATAGVARTTLHAVSAALLLAAFLLIWMQDRDPVGLASGGSIVVAGLLIALLSLMAREAPGRRTSRLGGPS